MLEIINEFARVEKTIEDLFRICVHIEFERHSVHCAHEIQMWFWVWLIQVWLWEFSETGTSIVGFWIQEEFGPIFLAWCSYFNWGLPQKYNLSNWILDQNNIYKSIITTFHCKHSDSKPQSGKVKLTTYFYAINFRKLVKMVIKSIKIDN